MRTGLLALIRTKYNTLSQAQQAVADYVLANPAAVIMSTLSDIASLANVSETTIIRFLHKLNYSSYQVFRVKIAQEISTGKTDGIYDEVTEGDSVPNVVDKVIQSTARAIQDSEQIIDPEQIEILVNNLLHARHILIIGMGSSAAQAYDMCHKLLKLDIPCCTYSHDPHLINIRAANMAEKDLLIIFSHSGESREVLDGARFAAANGCTVAAITSYPRSTLSSMSDIVILSSSRETNFHSDAMISRIIQLSIIDMIYIALVLKIGKKALKDINQSRIAVAGNKT